MGILPAVASTKGDNPRCDATLLLCILDPALAGLSAMLFIYRYRFL